MKELSYDDVEFFAHLTERDKESSIFEKGLYIDDNKISSCANKVTDSFYEDPEHFIDYELGSPQTRGKEIMILIASQKDDERSLIERNDDGIYNLEIDFIIEVDKDKLDIKLSHEHTSYKWVSKDSELIDEFIKEKLSNVVGTI